MEPALDPRYEEPEAARAEIAALLARDGASGVVALRDGEVAGYLVGVPLDEIWGPNMWVEPAGHAASAPELVRDLYGAAAAAWVAEGRTSHYAMVPATDPELVDAWFRLGFGHQHVSRDPRAARRSACAARGDHRAARSARGPRRARPRGAGARRAPGSARPSSRRSARRRSRRRAAEWDEDFDDPTYTTFVAERDGTVLGSAIGCAIEVSSLHRSLALPRGAGFLGFAAVLPEHRGLGAGRVLGETILAWAKDAGYPTVVTDWRMTNLLSSRTWPRLGFRPTFYRLFRAIA